MMPVVACDCAVNDRDTAPHTTTSAASTTGTRCKGLSMRNAPPGEMSTWRIGRRLAYPPSGWLASEVGGALQQDELGNGLKTEAVMGGEAVGVQGGEVGGGAVPLVVFPEVPGMPEREQLHQPVADGLGDDRGGRDTLTAGVAVDDRRVRHAELGARQPVDQDVGRRAVQAVQGPAHRQNRGAADVEPVDLVDARGAHADGQGALADDDGDLGACRGGEPLRIVEAAQRLGAGGKHDGRGHHRTSEGTAADFIDAGDEPPSRAPERGFALERGAAAGHVEGCSDASGDSAPGTPSPRCSRMRAALPARRRRKYSFARRTRPLRTSSTSAMAGECRGKMRSTPTPAEILRTVKVSSMPPPRRAMHTPSNA